jgi:hypothetical protein
VSGVQRIDNFCSQLQHLLDCQRLSVDHVLECLSLQQLHGNEVLTIGIVDLMNRADVRMIECGSSEGFPLEPLAYENGICAESEPCESVTFIFLAG